MKYVIDSTQRKTRWKNAFPYDVRVVTDLEVGSITINRDDIVFAHTPTDFRLGSTGDGNDRISQFRRIIPIIQEEAPLFFMYSGNGIGFTYEKPWIDLCVTIALPGFPTDRVKVIRDVIHQTGSAQDLAATINDCLTQWRMEQPDVGASVGNDASKTTSNASASAGYSMRDPSAFLALRLLCDAYDMNLLGVGQKKYTPPIHPSERFVFDCPDLAEWFDLLGATAPSGNQDAPAIEAFGKLMGEAGEKAEALARAIVSNTDLSKAVADYRDKADELREKGAGQ